MFWLSPQGGWCSSHSHSLACKTGSSRTDQAMARCAARVTRSATVVQSFLKSTTCHVMEDFGSEETCALEALGFLTKRLKIVKLRKMRRTIIKKQGRSAGMETWKICKKNFLIPDIKLVFKQAKLLKCTKKDRKMARRASVRASIFKCLGLDM